MVASSRESTSGAGWHAPDTVTVEKGRWTWLLADRLRPPARPFRWISVDALLRSYNDLLTRFAGERIVYEQRARWMDAVHANGLAMRFEDQLVNRTELTRPRFLVVGDPGEGDASQYCVATALRNVDPGDFLVLCSDVIYPAGDVNDYADRFYVPYRDYPSNIYALPGNHDWYDLLHGFMLHFCGTIGPFELPRARGIRSRIARVLWKKPRQPEPALLDPLRAEHPPWRGSGGPVQPGPYYAIDTGPVRLVCIDTGVNGLLDAEQGQWLRRMSAGPKPKVLLTGKPLVVDYELEPCEIRGGGTVDDIVRDPDHNYVAAIGGDIHNYQRYPVTLADGRTLQYVVAGGGGAYMAATHGLKPGGVPKNLPEGVTFPGEDDVRLYPLRGDSLAFYARQAVPYLRRLLASAFLLSGGLLLLAAVLVALGLLLPAVLVTLVPVVLLGYLAYIGAARVLSLKGPLQEGLIDADVAAAFIAERYGMRTTRASAAAATVTDDERRVLDLVMPLRERGVLVKFLSEILDSDQPPFFKQFLELWVEDDDTLVIQCRAVTGWSDAEAEPPVEDRVEIPLEPLVS
ncbi:MAG TPA: metallophosphoesterase [Pseudonocardiaceae bacterium]